MTEISSANDTSLAAGKVCLILTAPWCGMCKMMKPTFEKMASSGGDIVYMMADVDKMPAVAVKYGVKALPSAVLLRDGIQKKTLHGGDINKAQIAAGFDA